jgi:hypothetical protein
MPVFPARPQRRFCTGIYSFPDSQLIVFIPLFFRGVIYYESTNPFGLRPVGRYGVF